MQDLHYWARNLRGIFIHRINELSCPFFFPTAILLMFCKISSSLSAVEGQGGEATRYFAKISHWNKRKIGPNAPPQIRLWLVLVEMKLSGIARIVSLVPARPGRTSSICLGQVFHQAWRIKGEVLRGGGHAAGDERLTEHPVIGAGDQLSAGDQSVPDNHCNYFRKGAGEYKKGRENSHGKTGRRIMRCLVLFRRLFPSNLKHILMHLHCIVLHVLPRHVEDLAI